MTTDLRAHLDRLDTALAAATPGPWAQSEADPAYVIAPRGDEDYEDVADAGARCSPGRPGWQEAEADAAAIVAAVNALPGLLAAVRAAADLADEMETASALPVLSEFDRGIAVHQRDAADRIHTALAAALAEGDQA